MNLNEINIDEIKSVHNNIKDIFAKEEAEKYLLWFKDNKEKLNYFYELLEDNEEKDLYAKTVYTKLTGHVYVPEEEKQKYLLSREQFDKELVDDSVMKLKSVTRKLKFYNLKNLGYDLKLYGARALLDKIVVHNQYSHKNCRVRDGDFVIDGGGCWGDTALIFADKAGEKGKVFTFEFFEDNLNVLKKNFSLNETTAKKVVLIEKPLYNKSDNILYLNNACADITTLTETENNSHGYETISADDFVSYNKIKKIDFIKLDIEGCELKALSGAERTIKKYKPKLAIAAYHKYDDYYEIPKFINELNLGYKFYFSSYTPIGTDTVIYAK